jgi:hypothetical protein
MQRQGPWAGLGLGLGLGVGVGVGYTRTILDPSEFLHENVIGNVFLRMIRIYRIISI